MFYEKEMDADEINYRTLRKIQQIEKNSPVLTKIDSDFYSALSGYLKGLDNRLGKESSSQKQMLLKDEIQNTRKIAMNIYEQREKKILLAAITKARGGNPDLKNMMDVEKDLYNPVLNQMLKSRKIFLKNENTDNSSNGVETVESREDPNTPNKIEGDQKNSNPIVRVTQDVPEFIGTDEKKYNLRNNDIISLPEEMSEMLSKRGAVKKIKQ